MTKNPQHDVTGRINVLVIGESLRADFMSTYGFSRKTTPFLDQTPKILINRYISTAANTNKAVPRILSLSNKSLNPIVENNILHIAKEAGFKTIWLSSQGFGGGDNIPTTRIARLADETSFVSRNDFDLIPRFKKNDQYQRRFIYCTAYHGVS